MLDHLNVAAGDRRTRAHYLALPDPRFLGSIVGISDHHVKELPSNVTLDCRHEVPGREIVSFSWFGSDVAYEYLERGFRLFNGLGNSGNQKIRHDARIQAPRSNYDHVRFANLGNCLGVGFWRLRQQEYAIDR